MGSEKEQIVDYDNIPNYWILPLYVYMIFLLFHTPLSPNAWYMQDNKQVAFLSLGVGTSKLISRVKSSENNLIIM